MLFTNKVNKVKKVKTRRKVGAQTCMEEKTVLCGHWHTSYGQSKYEHRGPEFGPGADFSPYIAPGIIALDACTAYSGKVNIYIIEDEPRA